MESITEINIKEISLSGFRSRKEPAVFSFGDITCVTGHNGAGKTTLAHAIAFAFYGVTYFGEQKTDRLINSECGACTVTLKFTDQNGISHTLSRSRSGNRTELIFDSYTVRQEDINRFICDRDTFLCIFNPLYLLNMSADKGRDILMRCSKTVNADNVLKALSENFRSTLSGLEITEPYEMISSYRAGIRRCDEQLKIIEAQKQTLRETEQANSRECGRLAEQADASAAAVNILREKQFSGIDKEYFKARRAELAEKLKTASGSSCAAKIAACTEKLKAAREREYVSKFAGEAAKLDSEINALREKYIALKEKLQSLTAGSKCPTCSVTLTDELLTKVKAEITAGLKEITGAAKGITETKNELAETDRKAKETFEQYKKEDIESLSAELDSLKKAETAEDSPDIMQKEIEEIDLLLTRGLLSDEELSELETETKNLAALEAQIKKLREYSAAERIAELESQAEAFKNNRRSYAEIVSALCEYISKRTELVTAEFEMPNVSLTLFETVKTTGELKSVFRFAYKGTDVSSVSLSERTAAGLEISALVRRLTGLKFPVLIDNTESIAEFDSSRLDCQTVFLRMVKNTPLSVKHVSRAPAADALKRAS